MMRLRFLCREVAQTWWRSWLMTGVVLWTAAGLAEAAHYATPLGRRPRTAELVRAAVSELRDPERRLVHEFWAAGWGQQP